MNDGDWLTQLPLIGLLPPAQAAAKLREVGEDEIADAITATPEAMSTTYGVPLRLGTSPIRAFMHTTHIIGYLAPATAAGPGLQLLRHAASIPPDKTLSGARIKVTLDGLRAADYPGRGIHHILLDFEARNQTSRGPEHLHFTTTCRAAEGEQAAVSGRPIFTGLRAGPEGIFLKLATVNVHNKDDEKLLQCLNSDVFRGGLQLLTTVQPALAPFSALAVGLTNAIADRHRNIAVQGIDFGLDFSDIAPRPRLAEGSYIAVQIPQTDQTEWSWQNWAYDPANGQLASTSRPGQLIPYNYIVISISRYQGPN